MRSDTRPEFRHYLRSDCAVFNKTKERHGGMSNMAGGYPIEVNGIGIRTSEALYQACRFPQIPDLQRQIIGEHSPMAAKMRGKPFRASSRPDWDDIRVTLMRWCIRVKLLQNPDKFGSVLDDTGDLPIVEHSRRDRFWGAVALNDEELEGQNVLGRLLMELRDQMREIGIPGMSPLPPVAVKDFALLGEPIETIEMKQPNRPSPEVDDRGLSPELQHQPEVARETFHPQQLF